MLSVPVTIRRQWSAWTACGLILTVLGNTATIAVAQQVPGSLLPEEINRAHPLVPALNMAYESQAALEQVSDYEAQFSKRERVDRQMVHHVMRLKHRHAPNSVYLYFDRPHTGREVLYVDGKNRNMLLAHETGIRSIVGTVSLDPNGAKAMEENRHPVTRIGLRGMINGVIAQWEEEAKYGEVEVNFYPNARLGEYDCKVIETSHPTPRKQFRYAVTRLFIDKQTNLPVRIEQYGFPAAPGGKPSLEEEYTYTNLRTNIGLTDHDFDPRNPNYGF